MPTQSLAPRIWRAVDRLKLAAGLGGRTRDPRDGRLVGELTEREALAAGRLELGRHSYGSFRVNAGPGDDARLRIGAFCSIGVRATFALGGNHRPDWVSTYPFRVAWELPGAHEDGHPRPERDTVVGNDVWIGADALILPGVQVGDGAVIGARAVVARDVRPYAIVVGSPAREVRRRFDDEQVQALLDTAWWTWDDARIRESVDLLCSPDVGALVARGQRTTR